MTHRWDTINAKVQLITAASNNALQQTATAAAELRRSARK